MKVSTISADGIIFVSNSASRLNSWHAPSEAPSPTALYRAVTVGWFGLKGATHESTHEVNQFISVDVPLPRFVRSRDIEREWLHNSVRRGPRRLQNAHRASVQAPQLLPRRDVFLSTRHIGAGRYESSSILHLRECDCATHPIAFTGPQIQEKLSKSITSPISAPLATSRRPSCAEAINHLWRNCRDSALSEIATTSNRSRLTSPTPLPCISVGHSLLRPRSTALLPRSPRR